MHTSQYNHLTIHYNSDYSGTIKVYINNEDVTVNETFTELVQAINGNNTRWTNEELSDIKEFVAAAVMREEVSRLEQLDSEEILADDHLKKVLQKMYKNLTS